MKKPKFYLILTICVLLIIAVATACTFTGAPEPSVTPTEPTETTTTPTEPTATEPHDPRLLNDEQLAELQTILTGHLGMRTNWYNAAMLATFDSPQELDAYDLFSVGTGNPEDHQLTDEELAYLNTTDLAASIDNTCRMSRAYAEQVLDMYFGLTPEDLHTEYRQFVYWDKTDCYYFLTEPPHVIDFRLLGARRQEDGTLLFEYYDPYTNQPKDIYEAVIRSTGSGYRFLSNRIVEKSSLNPDAKLESLPIADDTDFIKKLETLFANPQTVDTIYYNWYNDCLRAHLSCPEDLDVSKIFCGRTGIPDNRQLTEAETAYLQDFYGMYIAMYNNKPIQRIPRETVEQVLHLYYGLSPEDVQIESSNMVYWEETDCYYVIVDSTGIGLTKVLRVDVLSDNTIRMLYTDPTDTYRDTVYEAVLRPALGGYQILSNLRVVNPELSEKCPLSPSPRPNPLNILGLSGACRDYAFNYALKSIYETPADVNIFDLFYSMPKDDTLSDAEIEFAINKGLNPEISPIYRYPTATMDSVLRRVFGLGFDECNGVGLENFVYNPKTDCYYESHGDFMDASYSPTHMAELADGSVQIYYSGLVNYEFQDMVVTLVPTETSWHIVSNVPGQAILVTSEWIAPEDSAGDIQITSSRQWTGIDGNEYTLQSKGYDGLCVVDSNGRTAWTVPGTRNPQGIQWLICDGHWGYGILSNRLLRINLQTGGLETLFTAEKFMCDAASGEHAGNISIVNGKQLYFLAKEGDRIGLYRMQLSTKQAELLHDQIPGDTLPYMLELSVPWHTDEEIHCFYLNPELQPLLLDALKDPNSTYRGVFRFDVDSREEPVTIDLSPAWEIPDPESTMGNHPALEFLIIQLQNDHDILAKCMVTYNTQTGEVTKTDGWAKPYGDFAPYIG